MDGRITDKAALPARRTRDLIEAVMVFLAFALIIGFYAFAALVMMRGAL